MIFIVSLCSHFIANDKPLILHYGHKTYFPILYDYPATTFGGQLATFADYHAPNIQKYPATWMDGDATNPFSYDTHDFTAFTPQPSAPSSRHWLGTDDQGRDICARILYALRVNIAFGLLLTTGSLIIGVSIGACQGYFGG